jgi:hypothetical protein
MTLLQIASCSGSVQILPYLLNFVGVKEADEVSFEFSFRRFVTFFVL